VSACVCVCVCVCVSIFACARARAHARAPVRASVLCVECIAVANDLCPGCALQAPLTGRVQLIRQSPFRELQFLS
jgi:hypothetical protein